MSWRWIHVGLIVGSMACFFIAVTCAVLYLFQSSQLKSKHVGKVFFKLPSLAVLDRAHFIYSGIGVVFFTLAILSGAFWATFRREPWLMLKEPTVLLSLVTCAFYWVIVGMRASAFTRGKKIAAGTVVIFLLLFLTVLSTYCPISVFHHSRGIA